MQIQISWVLQKPTDLDLHCLQRQGTSGFSRTMVNTLRTFSANFTRETTFVSSCLLFCSPTLSEENARTKEGKNSSLKSVVCLFQKGVYCKSNEFSLLVLKVFCLSSEKRSIVKRKEFFPTTRSKFFPFVVDPL